MRIAIVKLSALGDIVHAMIVLQYIKKFNPKISIDWIVEERFQDLLKFNPHINKLHLVSLKNAKKNNSILSLLKELNKLRHYDQYDLVIDMQGLLKSAIISKLLPSKQIIGFDKYSTREKLASNFYNKKLSCPYEKNVIERNLALIAFALGTNFQKKKLINKTPFLFSTTKKLNTKLSESKKNILIIPGASNDSKRYPTAKLAELTQLFDAAFFVIWGSEEEKILACEIKDIAPNVNICSKLNLNSLIFLISKVDLVIGPDSGPTHISWALNVPSITLFGPTPGYRNTIETSMNRVIESNSKVNPLKIDQNDYSIETISVQEIVSTTRELLD